jgi:hypothetical protein
MKSCCLIMINTYLWQFQSNLRWVIIYTVLNVFDFARYDSKKLLITFLIVMIALTVEVGISNIADIVSKDIITFWGIALFIVIAAIYIGGQYIILEMIKAKNRERNIKAPFIDAVNKAVTIAQYSLAAIMLFVVIQIVVTSTYYTNLLSASTAISYGLAIFLMSILTYRLFSWFKLNKSLVVLMYGLAGAAMTVNAVDTIVYYDAILLAKSETISPKTEVIFQTGFSPGTAMSMVNLVQTYSLNAYFLFIWGGTILLLHHHIQRVGRIKFWILVTLPIVYFLSYEISYYQSFYPSSPVTTAISSNLMLPILLYTYAITICGVLFGLGFRSTSRGLSQHIHVRDYMIIAAYGFVLFLNAASATVLQAAYPPYGLANVSFVGLASFLILTGLYQSAISVSQDIKLRQSIRKSTIQQSNLLDSIGTAQMTKELEKRVMEVTRANADILTQKSGIEPSLTTKEIKEYFDTVREELVKRK